MSYHPVQAFETFPQPQQAEEVAAQMRSLHDWREEIMAQRDEGVTELYGHFHDPARTETEFEELRQRHQDLDAAVLAAYGWEDLDLSHGFYEARYGLFFTVSDEARFELLSRLLDLNFRQYAEETGHPYEQVIKEAVGG